MLSAKFFFVMRSIKVELIAKHKRIYFALRGKFRLVENFKYYLQNEWPFFECFARVSLYTDKKRTRIL